MEQWREIKGYEGRYEVSDHGNVRSLLFYSTAREEYMTRKAPRLLSQNTTHDGYKRVSLSKYREMKSITVHRLVAMAFLPNPNNYPAVNHKDEDATNNHVSNLEWCTNKYNSNYGTLPKRISERMRKNHYLARPVIQMSNDGEEIATYPSTREAARQFGIRSENISRCCYGRYKHAAGYKWKYANTEKLDEKLTKHIQDEKS